MAKSAKKTAADPATEPERGAAEVYAEHNDVTAQDGPVEKQCQCAKCSEYRKTQ